MGGVVGVACGAEQCTMGIVVYNPQALKAIFCLLSAKKDPN